jgi:hypothetical protein
VRVCAAVEASSGRPIAAVSKAMARFRLGRRVAGAASPAIRVPALDDRAWLRTLGASKTCLVSGGGVTALAAIGRA